MYVCMHVCKHVVCCACAHAYLGDIDVEAAAQDGHDAVSLGGDCDAVTLWAGSGGETNKEEDKNKKRERWLKLYLHDCDTAKYERQLETKQNRILKKSRCSWFISFSSSHFDPPPWP